MLDALFAGFGSLLAFFYDLIPSYGAAITLLTLTVMLATFPLTLKQTRSMLAMQRLAPELKRLQKEFKGDRQAMSEAQMALYKEHGVNPLAGCLPMVLQAPIFIVLFNVIRGLTHRSGGQINPKYVPHTSEIFHALREAGGEMISFGIDLAKAPNASHGSFLNALPFYALVAASFASSYFQLQRMTARNPQAAQANPQMQMMNRIFPVMSGFFCLTVPAGVGIYLVVSNLFRIAQQELMYKFDPHVTKHHLALREGKFIDIDETKEAQAKPEDPGPPKAIEPSPEAKAEGAKPLKDKPTKPLSSPPSSRNGANGGGRRATGAGKARNARRRKKKGR